MNVKSIIYSKIVSNLWYLTALNNCIIGQGSCRLHCFLQSFWLALQWLECEKIDSRIYVRTKQKAKIKDVVLWFGYSFFLSLMLDHRSPQQ